MCLSYRFVVWIHTLLLSAPFSSAFYSPSMFYFILLCWMCVEVFSITASAALISEGLDMAHDPMSPEEAKGQTKLFWSVFDEDSSVSLDSFQWSCSSLRPCDPLSVYLFITFTLLCTFNLIFRGLVLQRHESDDSLNKTNTAVGFQVNSSVVQSHYVDLNTIKCTKKCNYSVPSASKCHWLLPWKH